MEQLCPFPSQTPSLLVLFHIQLKRHILRGDLRLGVKSKTKNKSGLHFPDCPRHWQQSVAAATADPSASVFKQPCGRIEKAFRNTHTPFIITPRLNSSEQPPPAKKNSPRDSTHQLKRENKKNI